MLVTDYYRGTGQVGKFHAPKPRDIERRLIQKHPELSGEERIKVSTQIYHALNKEASP
jgi:hypothetical protein